MSETKTKMIYIFTIIELLLVFCQQIIVCNSIAIEHKVIENNLNIKTQFELALREAVTDLKTVLAKKTTEFDGKANRLRDIHRNICLSFSVVIIALIQI